MIQSNICKGSVHSACVLRIRGYSLHVTVNVLTHFILQKKAIIFIQKQTKQIGNIQIHIQWIKFGYCPIKIKNAPILATG